MKQLKYVSLMLILVLFAAGCSGSYGKFKTQSESESIVTQRELIDNWANYAVYFTRYGYSSALKPSESPFKATLIVFDPKNDDREILVGKYWGTIKDQETWTKIVKANTTRSDSLAVGWIDLSDTDNSTEIQEIWSSDNQLYGIIIRPRYYNTVVAKQVDENTIQLLWQRTGSEYFYETY